VNSIKVIPTKLMNSEVQLLYSGSEDGFINVYNLDQISQPNEDFDEEMPVKTRRAKPSKKKNPVYLFSLDSTDFTGLKNNKKINIIDISNKRGLIYSGCYGGDLFIWRNDNYRRDRPVKEAYELVSKIKAHNQILHLISMSPDENYFMTGATDGTVKIWQQPETAQEINELIEDLENGRTEGGNKKEHPLKRNIIKAFDGSEELAICQCDAIEWSCRGRYAIFSFGGKEDEESLNDRSMIYIWDQRKREIIRKIGSKNSGITLDNFTFVLKCHPKFENYFVSGGGAGKVIIWDIHNGTTVNTFKETGIYQRDENILNEVFDGKFSS
jgi:WD40 repeat protein